MPNIYLRLPTSRCQFFRNRDPKHTLAKDEPLVFSPYMPHHFVLRKHITNIPAVTQKVNSQCFSHQQWRNMMQGKHPNGGEVVTKRDPHEYLSFGEVQRFSGRQDYAKSDNEDYLCIKLPSEVEVIDVVRQVTPVWNLSTRGIRQLLLMLNDDFKRSVVEWALATFDYCTSDKRIIFRRQTAMLERFLMRYGIDQNESEKDALRRIISRWLTSNHSNFKAYSCADMQYIDDSEKRYCVDDILFDD
ncbi:hypothetical protein [Prevotella sp.]|uniref:hypothetical protein n=1 Tax=Prevotella sp. TaxID=59823 RepID=UPI0020538200|nr:hypothetical protein [Prevotella sp.]DAJ92986.1 MAG TPA: hypothetical protein [Caudoviricetes sp.]DAU40921.1 MAG TPA: hypothetical protein [Caudoviricetes sp.]DAV09990.1 MAG TPA: hypothetical protein [Caudoviricetes sp.]